MFTRRQVKVNDRSARPLRRTVVFHSLRDEQKSWYLHPNAGPGDSTAGAHPASGGRTLPARPGQRSPGTPPRTAHRWALLTHSSRNDARTTEAPARSAARTRCWLAVRGPAPRWNRAGISSALLAAVGAGLDGLKRPLTGWAILHGSSSGSRLTWPTQFSRAREHLLPGREPCSSSKCAK
jgi:hypothetical protein